MHRNAPLTPEGRRRLIERCRTRPIAHVAAEMGISRATASKWLNRYRQYGELGLLDRPSTPLWQPTATQGHTVARIESMRREHKWQASRIAFELERTGTTVSRRTITRLLAELGLNRRKFIDPNDETNRQAQKIVAARPGHMVHLDVKKTGRIPDGGGWRAHGSDSAQAKAVARRKQRGTRTGYVYLHSAIAGHTRLAYTEALENEQAATADALDGAEHRRTRPYMPEHNGKVERYNRIPAEEFLYAGTWSSETERSGALTTWNRHYNYHRPHGAHGGKTPSDRVHNLTRNYT